MAFKLPFSAECDKCKTQITTYAHSEAEANKFFRAKGWHAKDNEHNCPICKGFKERQ